MYLEHYGFEVEPFEIAPNSEFLYLSKGHKKAFTFLNYALWNKDVFTLLTGEIGAGKTILLQHLLKTMPSAAEVVTIYQTQISPYELLYTIAERFGLVDGEDIPKSKLYQLVNNYIVESTRTIVIVVDEAQSLSYETLEELRMLAGIDIYSGKSNMNIILCGQPELKNIIESGSLEQLNQRIKLRFHLTRLDFEETKEYVQFRVYKAGQKLEIFTLDAIKQIYEFTQGLPRLINILADTALTCGYADGFYAISSRQIDDAVKELNWDSTPLPRSVNDGGKAIKSGLHKVVNINSKIDGNMTSEDAGNLLTVAQDIAHQLERIADSLSNNADKASSDESVRKK